MKQARKGMIGAHELRWKRSMGLIEIHYWRANNADLEKKCTEKTTGSEVENGGILRKNLTLCVEKGWLFDRRRIWPRYT
jgi:hypothetical protein